MSLGSGCRRQAPILTTRRVEALRFIRSAVVLWLLCATGIYLIGPAEHEPGGSADAATRSISAATIAAGAAAYPR